MRFDGAVFGGPARSESCDYWIKREDAEEMIVPKIERFGEKDKATGQHHWEEVAAGSALEGLLLPTPPGKDYRLLNVVIQPATDDQPPVGAMSAPLSCGRSKRTPPMKIATWHLESVRPGSGARSTLIRNEIRKFAADVWFSLSRTRTSLQGPSRGGSYLADGLARLRGFSSSPNYIGHTGVGGQGAKLPETMNMGTDKRLRGYRTAGLLRS